ncbi:MAG: hypothetical protein J2P51_12825 [Hyphomicrobiaceae bacterium]|nr:hypothetical protein [Hyphomicrobiaceae bacterium]
MTLVGGIAAILGGIVLVLGLMSGHPERTWWAYTTNFVFWVGVAQAMVVFAASLKLAKGHWGGVVIRFAEAGTAFTTVAVVLFIGLIIGRQYIFTWIHQPRPEDGFWLTTRWFFLRNGLILVVLTWLSWRFVRHDTAPDLRELETGQPVDRKQDVGIIARDAAILVLAFAFGYSLLAFDLIMSLAHKWVSNLFGIFYFMGSFLAALMMLAILAIALRGPMGLRAIYTSRQQHDLGKLCFGFTVFWAYLMWAQYLVIWYGNMPEETYFIFYRLSGAWRPVGVAVFLLVFLIPFIGLLGVKPKKFSPTMVGFALVSLIGIWLERYLEVVPSINGGAGPAIGVPEIGMTLFFGGLFLLSWAWFAGRYPILSPRLAANALEREHH